MVRGTVVAVKIQHRELRSTAQMDIWLTQQLMKKMKWGFIVFHPYFIIIEAK
jgi:predicted unusual protein kinase regulating ubiquinone biosynthesis (AarF/ABC1/UbiB family)